MGSHTISDQSLLSSTIVLNDGMGSKDCTVLAILYGTKYWWEDTLWLITNLQPFCVGYILESRVIYMNATNKEWVHEGQCNNLTQPNTLPLG